MAVIRWFEQPEFARPLQVLDRLQKEMNRVFSDVVGKGIYPVRVGVFPPINVSEDTQGLYVRAELPGINPADVEISVEGSTITLRGEKKPTEAGENVNFHRRERDHGRFRRVLNLPTRFDPDAVEATFKNGVLTVRLPKAKEVLPKQIQVKKVE